jgi:taurine dioxygenase
MSTQITTDIVGAGGRAEAPRFDTIAARPVSAALGAEIVGADLSRPLSDGQFAEIQSALYHFGVIFFRGQSLTPEQHIAFAERWGPINVNRFFRPVAGYPMIAEVVKEPHQITNIGGDWHTDQSYDEVPALGSILYAREVPAVGGDTLYASMYLAYETLSDGLKTMLEGLRAHHSSRHAFGDVAYEDDTTTEGRTGNPEMAVQDASHPVVIRHPGSGRKALYVNPGFTIAFEGWSEADSKPLLDHLYAHATRPEFLCRFRWETGSLAMWDNRATWHYALNDYRGERRLLHRITVEGVPLG